MEKKRIAFIGTGVMGSSMAGHLLRAGHQLVVHNRTRSKAEQLLSNGAAWADTPAAAAQDAQIVITIVGFPKDVEETYFGSKGVLSAAPEGAILVDMTTSRPDLAVRIAEAAAERGCYALDAPVSGGDVGAREARLSIMVGGEEKAYEAVLPALECMGANVVLQGGPGSGQHTKMCNQIAIASGMLGVTEALVYAEASGLSPETVLKSIESGAAGSWSLSNLVPRMIERNFEPGFYVKHFIKDLSIALESAKAMKLDLPGLELATTMYKKLSAASGGDMGTQGLYTLYHPNR
jgi:3-hydroxyisobutyrate dehydrogenase